MLTRIVFVGDLRSYAGLDFANSVSALGAGRDMLQVGGTHETADITLVEQRVVVRAEAFGQSLSQVVIDLTRRGLEGQGVV